MSRTYPFENWASVFMVDTIAEFGIGGTYPGNGFAIAPLYIDENNASIAATRQQKTDGFNHVFTSENMIESSFVSNKTAEITSQFPLYLTRSKSGRRANFDISKLKELFSDVEEPDQNAPKVYPEDILDYVYATLHSPVYRQKYKQFLKADFPRVPRPRSWGSFWGLVELGGELRQLHLMKSSTIYDYDTTFPHLGDNIVGDVRHFAQTVQVGMAGHQESSEVANEKNAVYINKNQYFGNIPKETWEFYIGGYQPAQKWLKDRKGHQLKDADIDHYQKIIKILTETRRIMQEIDKQQKNPL